MRMVDIIDKKRRGEALTRDEINFWISGMTKREIPDYQSSALAMAIVLLGMEKEETYYLTGAMKRSGDELDLSSIDGVKVDKHSTGGVGDKTSLVLGPMVAACGAKVAKMSGRGLGHTGGTLDKLESIPGLNVYKNKQSFIDQVNHIGIAIVGQTDSLVPADKILYALRDVTATVESIPLIASSVMSKKLASGSDTILLDVTVGSGAFMKNIEDASKLAELMIRIGQYHNRDTRAIISNMDEPIGYAVGNILEIKEVIESLNGKGPSDLMELCYEAGSIMLMQAKLADDKESALQMLKEVIDNGKALDKFKELVKAEGGDVTYIDNPSKFKEAKYQIDLLSKEEGYIHHIDALTVGLASMRLGGGRETKDDVIDMSAGIYLNKKVGDYVKKGEKLLTFHTNKEDYQQIVEYLYSAYKIDKEMVSKPSLILKIY